MARNAKCGETTRERQYELNKGAGGVTDGQGMAGEGGGSGDWVGMEGG